MLKTISIKVLGKVQGVFYRQSSRIKAQSLGITGTVRNLPDGTVNIIATGDEKELEAFKLWCRQGPPRAIVNSLEIKELVYMSFSDFSIL
jgi:acylphosphatase